MSGSPVLVLVTGSGRSGTSSVAGSLKRLGLHVPQPEVPAGATNERGFYEPQWVIDFHKARLRELALHNIDSRPWAVDMVSELIADGRARTELTEWLVSQREHAPLVVKDPHALWFAEVWREAAEAVNLDLRFLTAIRHPAEVIGSRDLAYLQQQSEALRRTKETSNLAGWTHAALLTERAGRGRLRSFLRYTDLLSDWRAALAPVDRQLELGLAGNLAGGPHEIDSYLDSGLRRSSLTWEDLHVPPALRELAGRVWDTLQLLVEDPHRADALTTMDTAYDDYVRLYAQASDLTFDHTRGEVETATRQRKAQVQRLRRELRRLEAEQTGQSQQAEQRGDPRPAGILGRLLRR